MPRFGTSTELPKVPVPSTRQMQRLPDVSFKSLTLPKREFLGDSVSGFYSGAHQAVCRRSCRRVVFAGFGNLLVLLLRMPACTVGLEIHHQNKDEEQYRRQKRHYSGACP